jgi:hypothetical protein
MDPVQAQKDLEKTMASGDFAKAYKQMVQMTMRAQKITEEQATLLVEQGLQKAMQRAMQGPAPGITPPSPGKTS